MTESRDRKQAVGSPDGPERWKHDGVRVIPGDQLDPNVPSTAERVVSMERLSEEGDGNGGD